MTVENVDDDVVAHLDLVLTTIGDGRVCLTVTGEVDLATAGLLSDAVQAAAAAGPTVVELDLTGVPFIDSSGIGAIVRSHRAMVAAGGRLVIGARSDAVARVLAVSGVEAAMQAAD